MTIKQIILAGLCTAVTAILAQFTIVVPFSPIPITLQVLAVSLSGVLLGAKSGAISQLAYVLLGICGLPVFAGLESGIGVILGPKGGYIIGFPFMAFVTGLLVELFEKKSAISRISTISRIGRIRTYISMAAGLAICYIFGTAWLGYVLELDLLKAVAMGMGFFLPFDLIKLFAAAFIGYEVRNALTRAGLIKLKPSQ